jgi:hypothetical protein
MDKDQTRGSTLAIKAIMDLALLKYTLADCIPAYTTLYINTTLPSMQYVILHDRGERRIYVFGLIPPAGPRFFDALFLRMTNLGVVPRGLLKSRGVLKSLGDNFGGDSFLFTNKGYTAVSLVPGSEC